MAIVTVVYSICCELKKKIHVHTEEEKSQIDPLTDARTTRYPI